MKYLLIILSFVAFSAQAQKIPPGKYKTNITVNDSIIPVIITVDSSTDIKTDYPHAGPTKKMLSFSFTLPAPATVSAGIYKGDLLVRTLFSNKNYTAGKHDENWEPLTDNLDTIKSVEGLTVKVLSNNVKYEWKGVIGNTSDSTTGNSVHHNYGAIQGMAFAGNFGYYATGYNERKQSFNKFNIATPNQRVIISSKKIAVSRVCTDGKRVYWGAIDPYNNTTSLIFATNCSDNSEVTFPNGVSYTTRSIQSTFPSCINVVSAAGGDISSMAIQQAGNFLFVTRPGIARIDVVNKITGAVVASHNLISYAIATDLEGNLWALVDGKASCYNVGLDGSLAIIKYFTGYGLGASITVSPNNEIVITDRTTATVNAYTTDGGLLWTLGRGGYEHDPTIYDDKFYWQDKRSSYSTFVSYQSDGSFWVGDIGNTRVQHFSADRNYLNNIAYRPISYNTCIDRNDTKRLFSDYCEYEVDYENVSWKLVRNWGYPVVASQDGGFKDVATLNGKTYTIGGDLSVKVSGGRYASVISELTLTGLKRIDTIISLQRYNLYPDGSLRASASSLVNGKRAWYRKNLINYQNGEPVWNNEYVFASVADDPLSPNFNLVRSGGEITSSNILLGYEGNDQRDFTYHLAGLKLGDSTYSWRAAKGTFKNYRGDFPADGSVDVGNGIVRTADVKHHAVGRFILYGQHGEFWKSSQTNMWNLYYDNGLMVGQFGTLGPDVANQQAPYGMAGNAFMGNVVEVNGNIYLTHNDEGHHSGIHLWKISNVNSIANNTYPVSLSDIPIDTNTIDLMGELPFNAVLVNNNSGWIRSPLNETTRWSVKTSVKTYDRFSTPDIYTKFSMPAGSIATLSKNIGTYDLKKWSIEGDLNNDDNTPNRANYGGMYFDILDSLGGVILRLTIRKEGSTGTSIYANSTLIAKGIISEIKKVLDQYQHFKLSLSSDVLTFQFADYPSKVITTTALVNKPSLIRFYFFHNSFLREKIISFKDFKLIK